MGDEPRWNHNIHYHRVVLDALPPVCESVLDVGCGEGMLAREVRALGPSVTGIDLDEPSIALARSGASADVAYVHGDFLTYPFAPESFDAVVSIATLHHMDAEAGLARMAELVRPGGVVAVIGLARSRYPRDLPMDAAGAVATRWLRWRKGGIYEHSAPIVWPPPVTYADMREVGARVLPGSRYRRLVLWRYALIWTKPGST